MGVLVVERSLDVLLLSVLRDLEDEGRLSEPEVLRRHKAVQEDVDSFMKAEKNINPNCTGGSHSFFAVLWKFWHQVCENQTFCWEVIWPFDLIHKLRIIHQFYIMGYTSVTIATAAVRSYISTVSRNSTAAAVFLRLHTLAVTFATAAVRRILIYGDRKTAAALRPLRWWCTVAVGRPCGSRSFYDKY